MQPQPNAFSIIDLFRPRVLILVAVLAVAGGTLFYLSQRRAEQAQPTADRFVAALCAGKFEAARALAPGASLESLRRGYGGLYRIKRCSSVGFDGNPFGDAVQIDYLCHGRPGDRRNLLVVLRQRGERWLVVETRTSWHLGRGDRAFAERFVGLLAAGKQREAARLTRGVSETTLTSAREILGRGGWTLGDFRHHHRGKGARLEPRAVNVSFVMEDNWISFDCMEQHGKRWIVKLHLP